MATAVSEAWAMQYVTTRSLPGIQRSVRATTQAITKRRISGRIGKTACQFMVVVVVASRGKLRHRSVAQQLDDRGVHDVGERLRIQAHGEHGDGEDGEHGELAPVEIE